MATRLNDAARRTMIDAVAASIAVHAGRPLWLLIRDRHGAMLGEFPIILAGGAIFAAGTFGRSGTFGGAAIRFVDAFEMPIEMPIHLRMNTPVIEAGWLFRVTLDIEAGWLFRVTLDEDGPEQEAIVGRTIRNWLLTRAVEPRPEPERPETWRDRPSML